MRTRLNLFLIGMVFVSIHLACAQGGSLGVQKTVEAGSAFSVHINGSGKSILYIVGPGQALMRSVQEGETVFFPVGSLCNVGHYLAIVGSGPSAENGSFDVVSATQPASISFLAKPSRPGVGLKNGISGAVYVFDAYHNLITAPITVFFQLSDMSGTLQKRIVVTHDGAAWTEMDSTDKAGIDTFEASVDGVSSTRVIEQVPGDPCGLKMSAKQVGQQLLLKTDMVRDCSGNSIPDGTIVTFTENYNGTQSTVDMPIKHGIAQVEIVAHNGAKISVASGVVLGNEIDWKK